MTRVLIVFFFWIMIMDLAIAQGVSGSQPAPAPEKTAGETMRNVHVLKDIPAGEWNDVMFFINGALGVGCEHCHAPQFEADSKKPKLIARNMMKMVREINANNFDGKQVVTCNTCHQGHLKPPAIPALWNKSPDEIAVFQKQRAADQAGATPPPAPAPSPSQEPPPSVAQVFANYRKAVGGPPNQSLHLAVDFAGDLQPKSNAEIDIVYPDKLLIRVQLPKGEARTVINGSRGWQITPQGTHDLPAANVEASKNQFMDLFKAVKFADAESTAKVTGTEKIGDRTYTVVDASFPRGTRRLYFDALTGLLYRTRVETRAADFGISPVQVTLEDYRDVNGAKMPFSLTNNSASDRVHITITQMQLNPAIDPAKFSPPAPAPAAK